MRKAAGIIALDLDGTLLNSKKELSSGNRAALERAAAAGYEIVPTTGRFYGGMPQVIRDLPFIRYVITINGAEVRDLQTDEALYTACIPCAQAVELMAFLDQFPLIYDCFMANRGWMSEGLKSKIDETVDDAHYREMLHNLRQGVPELKEFLTQRGEDVQKVQFFTRDARLRLQLMGEIPRRFPELVSTSSQIQNVELNQLHANKGEALLALSRHLGLSSGQTIAFGDGLNDVSMLKRAGIGIAMGNAEPAVVNAADQVTDTCDKDGVAKGILKYCFGEGFDEDLM